LPFDGWILAIGEAFGQRCWVGYGNLRVFFYIDDPAAAEAHMVSLKPCLMALLLRRNGMSFWNIFGNMAVSEMGKNWTKVLRT
jgi:hypothetical protein